MTPTTTLVAANRTAVRCQGMAPAFVTADPAVVGATLLATGVLLEVLVSTSSYARTDCLLACRYRSHHIAIGPTIASARSGGEG